jgi:hypothetical protein
MASVNLSVFEFQSARTGTACVIRPGFHSFSLVNILHNVKTAHWRVDWNLLWFFCQSRKRKDAKTNKVYKRFPCIAHPRHPRKGLSKAGRVPANPQLNIISKSRNRSNQLSGP